jgi:hypothetical protein
MRRPELELQVAERRRELVTPTRRCGEHVPRVDVGQTGQLLPEVRDSLH